MAQAGSGRQALASGLLRATALLVIRCRTAGLLPAPGPPPAPLETREAARIAGTEGRL